MGYLESELFSAVCWWLDKIQINLTALKRDLKSQSHHAEQFYIFIFLKIHREILFQRTNENEEQK